VNFRSSYSIIRQPHVRQSFALSPAPLAVELTKPGKLADRRASRERLDIYNRAQDLEEHSWGF